MKFTSLAALAAAVTLVSGVAQAETRVTLKSATAGSSYYQMTVQLGEALKNASNGQITATVEESQGSVQNVKEAPKRTGNYVFTSPPSLVKDAQAAKKPFEGETGYDTIRTLFVMPGITMHVVTRADANVNSVADLAGKNFIAGGRGTFTERQSLALFKLFELEGKVKVAEVELSAASNALRNKQVDGFASGSSHPTGMIQELAATTPVKILSFSEADLKKILDNDAGAGRVVIAANTYAGQTQPVQTFGLPVGGYTTTAMDEKTAYEITKIFWTQRENMIKTNPIWSSVALDQVAPLGIKLHPGAAKFYAEQGVNIPAALK
jgi:TRAP transporter TAXI family solute receptor